GPTTRPAKRPLSRGREFPIVKPVCQKATPQERWTKRATAEETGLRFGKREGCVVEFLIKGAFVVTPSPARR
ncbi:MAG: hypothetical protein VXX66_12090, partial [Actinomycetota bacterium]|nr:hypothetical protein [Actinomycetota bacterium]